MEWPAALSVRHSSPQSQLAICDRDREQQVASRARDLGLPSAQHTGEVEVHLGAELAQSAGQQEIVLEAVAAAAASHELLEDVVGVERDRQPHQWIERLEGNRGAVSAVDLLHGGAPAQPDPLEIGVEIEHSRDCNEPPERSRAGA